MVKVEVFDVLLFWLMESVGGIVAGGSTIIGCWKDVREFRQKVMSSMTVRLKMSLQSHSQESRDEVSIVGDCVWVLIAVTNKESRFNIHHRPGLK